jgi:hypothetical protein
MDAATEIRSVSRRFEWRNHRRVARLSLQLDRRLSFDEKRGRGSSALHRDRRIFDQTAPPNADERSDFAFRAHCRSKRRSGDDRRNVEHGRKSLRNLSRRFRCGEGRPPRISPLVDRVRAAHSNCLLSVQFCSDSIRREKNWIAFNASTSDEQRSATLSTLARLVCEAFRPALTK